MTDPLDVGKAQAHSEDIVAPDADADLKAYYLDVLDWGDNDQVLDELIRIRRDHEGACKLAWELYLAGTGQTNESFRGTKGAPQDEVTWSRNDMLDALEQANVLICGGIASDPAMDAVWKGAEMRFRDLYHHILGVGVPLGGRLPQRGSKTVQLMATLTDLAKQYGLETMHEAFQSIFFADRHTAPGACGPECSELHTLVTPCRMASRASTTVDGETD